MPTNRAPRPNDGPERELFERYRRRLIGLARAHLDARLQRKVDPEDVVQSAYKSLLIRCGDEAVAAERWEEMWGLLTLITVRKCADRARYHRADCRDLNREAAPPAGGSEGGAAWREVAAREPTPDEAAALAETMHDLLLRLPGAERKIVELSLQGYSTLEISEQLGRAERSVQRIRERVRKLLQKQTDATI